MAQLGALCISNLCATKPYVTYARLMEDDDKNDSLEHFQKAFKWFQKASENGHSESMVELACQRHSKIDPFYLTNGEVKLTPLISY